MLFDLKNKVVLITGAASGIGSGVVVKLLQEGVKHVAVLDVDEKSGVALKNELNQKYGQNKVNFFAVDVTDEEKLFDAYKSVTEDQGYIDLVINNAAIMNDSMKTYKKEIEVNVIALITSSLKALELMRKDEGGKGGTIINISSIAALLQSPIMPVYYGTKSAVLQFSNCLGHVAILDIDEENSVALQGELNGKYGADKVKFYKCDVTNEEQLVGLFETILGDKTNEYVVINNAGILNDSLRTYKKQIEINVIALVTGSLKALELMRKDQGGKGGAIINISSIAALCPLPYTPIYNATKSAVLVFSSGLGTDEYYARTGVRVLTMCFGATDTGLLALENLGNFDDYIAAKLDEPLQIYPSQKVESAAQSVVDAYKQGKSGSVWLSNANRPAEDITDTITEAFGIMSAPIFKKD